MGGRTHIRKDNTKGKENNRRGREERGKEALARRRRGSTWRRIMGFKLSHFHLMFRVITRFGKGCYEFPLRL